MQKDPKAAWNEYVAGAAKRFTSQMKDDAPASLGGSGGTSSEFVPNTQANSSGSLVGPPPPNYPVCDKCGGDSRYCAHSALAASLARPVPSTATMNGVVLSTPLDDSLKHYFVRSR